MPPPQPLDTRSGPLPFRQLSRSRYGLPLRLAPPLAGLLAVAALGAGQTDAAAAAETAYLAFAAGIVLLAVGAVARRMAVPVLGTSAVVALAWLVPTGPARGLLVEGAAAAALALAAVGRVRSPEPEQAALPRRREMDAAGGGIAALLHPVPALGLALGFQALVRADELLAPPSILWAVTVYALLPVAGVLATLALARLDGPLPAALAAAAALVLGPGFRPATVTALMALAAAAALFGDLAEVEGALARLVARPLARLLPGRARGGAEASEAARGRRLARAAAALLLVAPAAWNPATALISALAGTALALRRRPWVAPACAVAAAGAAGAVIVAGDARPLTQAVALAAAVPAAVPALAWPARGRIGIAAVAVVLALAAGMIVMADGALAAPAALAAAAVATGVGERRGGSGVRAAAALQSTWAALLLAGAALAGSYPWLRPMPLAVTLRRVGVATDWTGALELVAIALAVTLSVRALARDVPRRTAAAASVLAALCLLLHVPRTAAALIDDANPLVLAAPTTAWAATLAPTDSGGARGESVGEAVGMVVVDSALGNAADLAPGTPVATLSLRGVDRPARVWTLRIGTETGEWAADRSLRAGTTGPAIPDPWHSWLPAGGHFFGHTYRAVLDVAGPPGGAAAEGDPLRADRIELRLRPDLPPGVVMTIFRLELRP